MTVAKVSQATVCAHGFADRLLDMKSLAITLSSLLVLIPAHAQQISSATRPSFYIGYAVRDVPLREADEEWSSSATSELPSYPAQRPMPRPYPIRPGRAHRYAAGFGRYSGPEWDSADTVPLCVVVSIFAAMFIKGAVSR